jgi:hypothetical protein
VYDPRMTAPPVFWAAGPWPDAEGQPLIARPIDLHVAESRRAILDAADASAARSVLVLGAGECREIPVVELTERCERVILCDADAPSLARGIAQVDDRQRLELWVGDLTGLRDPLRALGDRVLDGSQSAGEAAAVLTREMHALAPSLPALPTPCDLLVTSCVLNQLHVVPLTEMIDRFAAVFPGHALPEQPGWLDAARALSLRMEDTLLDAMAGWLNPGGRAYLSETVEATIVRATATGAWARVGRVTMSRTPELVSMLPRGMTVERRRGWTWIPAPLRAPGEIACVYRVDAVILKL